MRWLRRGRRPRPWPPAAWRGFGPFRRKNGRRQCPSAPFPVTKLGRTAVVIPTARPTKFRGRNLCSVRISDSEAHGTDGGWLMEVTLDHIGPTLDRTSAPLPTLPLCQLCPFAATKTSQTEVRVAHATDFQQNRAWGLLWKHSQLLSRGSDTLAVLPALRSGSRRPRSSPATPSASPCGARCARLRRRSRTGAAQREIFSRIETSRGNTHSSCLVAPIH